jgi:DNA modification methylase
LFLTSADATRPEGHLRALGDERADLLFTDPPSCLLTRRRKGGDLRDRTWSAPGALVLDPFAGSGSIPVAALKLERRAACLEKVPGWAARVSERLAKTRAALP